MKDLKYIKYIALFVVLLTFLTIVTLVLKKKTDDTSSNKNNDSEVQIDVESRYNKAVSDNLTRVKCYKNTDTTDENKQLKNLKKIEYHIGYDNIKEYKPIEEEYYQYYFVYSSLEEYESAKNIDWEKEDGNFEVFDDKLVIIKTYVIRDKNSFLNTATEEELKKYMEEHDIFDTVKPYQSKYDSLIEKGYTCN